jgi:heme exporter protein D
MSEFFHMGGYAFYVWGSYAAALAVFAWNLLAPRLERRALLKKLREAGGA